MEINHTQNTVSLQSEMFQQLLLLFHGKCPLRKSFERMRKSTESATSDWLGNGKTPEVRDVLA